MKLLQAGSPPQSRACASQVPKQRSLIIVNWRSRLRRSHCGCAAPLTIFVLRQLRAAAGLPGCFAGGQLDLLPVPPSSESRAARGAPEWPEIDSSHCRLPAITAILSVVELSMELLHLTGVPIRRETFYAGFWDRGLAKMIDLVLLKICLLPFDLAFGTSVAGWAIGRESDGAQQIFFFMLFLIYSAILESSKQQATVGKRMLGILVTDLDVGRISFRRALLRSVMQGIGPIDYVSAVFSSRKHALHDLVAGTEVLPGTLYANQHNLSSRR